MNKEELKKLRKRLANLNYDILTFPDRNDFKVFRGETIKRIKELEDEKMSKL